MNPSGGGASSEKADVVLTYLRSEFPAEEVLHDPQDCEMADRYRIVRKGEVVHTLLVRRKFYDDNPQLAHMLAAMNVAAKMRAGNHQVDLK